MSLLGFVSLFVLLMCVAFFYLHTKFLRLHKSMYEHEALLREALEYKFHLLLFLAPEIEEPPINVSIEAFLDTVERLNQSLDYNLQIDEEEIAPINVEIAQAADLYKLSSAKYHKFVKTLSGRLLLMLIGDVT